MTSSTDKHGRQGLLDLAHEGSSDAQYQLGLDYFQDAAFGQARRWLKRATLSGSTDAALLLADQYLYGKGVSRSRSDAIEVLTTRADQGDARCCHRLAGLLLSEDPARARDWLSRALDSGSAEAWLFMAIMQKGHHHPDTAMACLRQAARHGSALAAVLCGTPAEDSKASYAVRLIDEHTIETAGLPPDHQSQTPDIEALLDDLQIPWPISPPVSWEQSPVLVIDDLINDWACLAIIDEVADWVQPSRTIDPVTGAHRINPVRTSDGWTMHPDQESCLLQTVRQHIARAWGLSDGTFEPASMLRYLPGQEYRPHVDYIDPVSELDRLDIRQHGQRLKTILICLHAPEAGGSTQFPRRKIDIPARTGRMLQFSNVTASGQVDPLSQHAGLPIDAGEKWMMALWLRGHA